MPPLFELRNITKEYNGRRVLDVPHIVLEQSRRYVFMGANGAGKSTLLFILAYLIPPSAGTVYWKGEHIDTLDRDTIRRKVTMITQNPYLFHTSVETNVAYGLKIRGVERETRNMRVRDALQQVGLEGFEKRKAYQLSGGETQRVAIARGLVLDPEVLLLDEPTANVDAQGIQQVGSILREINERRGITIIMATHNADQASDLAHQMFCLADGRIRPAFNGPTT